MFLNRIKQFFTYIFCSYDKKNDIEVKKILNEEEFKIFDKMSNYDKVHSYQLFKKVEKDEILSSEILYLKLALLHDNGKNHASLYKRIKKVLIGDANLDLHPLISFQKLEKINYDLALLCKRHHEKKVDKLMKRFQKLDDR